MELRRFSYRRIGTFLGLYAVSWARVAPFLPKMLENSYADDIAEKKPGDTLSLGEFRRAGRGGGQRSFQAAVVLMLSMSVSDDGRYRKNM